MTYGDEGPWEKKQSDKRNDSHEDSFLLRLLRHVLHTLS